MFPNGAISCRLETPCRVVLSELMTKVTLHYLQCRGRGQAVRAQLSDAAVEFEDRRFAIDDLANSWPPLAANPEETGPFSSVPVLLWNGFRVAQTLPILTYVDAKLGLHHHKSAEQLARQQMVTSAAYLDITVPLALLLWQPIIHPSTNIEKTIEATTQRIAAKLHQLEALWRTRQSLNEHFWWGAQPSSADFAVFEAWHTARLILQHRLRVACQQCPQLNALEAALRTRAKFAQCEAKAPEQQCASPSEMNIRATLSNNP